MPRGRELEISGSTHGLLGLAPLSWPLMSGVQHSTAGRDRGLLAQIPGVAANYGARVGSLGDRGPAGEAKEDRASFGPRTGA